jgi:hypothetical protein
MSIGSTPVPKATFAMTTWQKLYERAVLEADESKLSERILEARHAIFDRAEEILTASPSDERRALTGALKTLRILEGGKK